jgi:hypothetical protein
MPGNNADFISQQEGFPDLPLKKGGFPIDKLPEVIKGAVIEACLNDSVAPEIAFQSAISMVSLVCQDRLLVRRLDGVESVCSLYLLAIAGSGTRKTQVDNLFSAKVAEYDNRRKMGFDTACEDYRWKLEAQKDQEKILRGMRKSLLKRKVTSLYEAAISDAVALRARAQGHSENDVSGPDGVERDAETGLESGNSLSEAEQVNIQIRTIEADLDRIKRWHACNPPPRLFRLLYSDISPSTLEQRLQENWPSAALVSNEAGDILNSKTISHLSNLDRLWEGKPIDVERSKRQDSVSVADPRLTLSLMIQPVVFDYFLERKGEQARGIGFLARTLICKPSPNYGEREIRKGERRQTTWQDRFNARTEGLLDRVSADFNRRIQNRRTLSFTSDAQLAWELDYAENERLLRQGSKFIHDADFFSRYSEHVARLAALFHYFGSGRFEEDSFDQAAVSSEIPLPALESAVAVCQWYRTQFSELFNPQIILEKNGELVAAELLRMVLNWRQAEVPLVALQRNVKAHLRKKAAFEPVIDWLHETKRIKVTPVVNPATGRPADCIHFIESAPEYPKVQTATNWRRDSFSLSGGPKQNL